MAKKSLKKSKKLEATKPLIKMVKENVGIRPSFIVTSARSYSERGLQGNLEYHAGPLPRLQRPFSRYAC